MSYNARFGFKRKPQTAYKNKSLTVICLTVRLFS